jgi:hypothetical protein
MSTEKRKYPYNAWMLQPSFKPVEVRVVKRAYLHSYHEYDELESGKTVHINNLYPTKAAAIAYGRQQVEKTEADLVKRRENLNKKIAALNKAEGK